MKFNKETISTLGLIKLASGTITDPVEFLDLALPIGYTAFSLSLEDIQFSITAENIALAFSVDDGDTFPADTTNYDTYITRFTNFPAASDSYDSTTYSTTDWFSNSSVANRLSASIWPGNNATVPSYFFWSSSGDSFGNPQITTGICILNPQATVPPVISRANVLRLLPHGNGDTDPPTSGKTMTFRYFLWGVPTP